MTNKKRIKTDEQKLGARWNEEEFYKNLSISERARFTERDKEVKQQITRIFEHQVHKDSVNNELGKVLEKGFTATQEEKRHRMKNAAKFSAVLKEAGFDFLSGVPDGTQKHIIKNLVRDSDLKHVQAVRESEAIGIAAGASLAGKKSIVYMQNSGLLDSINDITSLLIEYKIPVLFLVGLRGAPGEDAPHHFRNGKTTLDMLNSICVHTQILTKDNMKKIVSRSIEWMDQKSLPSVILIIKGALK